MVMTFMPSMAFAANDEYVSNAEQYKLTLSSTQVTYNGSDQTPTPTLTGPTATAENPYVKDTDYIMKYYKSNGEEITTGLKDAGDYVAKAIGPDNTENAGKVYTTADFKIKPMPITSNMVTIPDQNLDAEKKRITSEDVTIKDVESTNYTVEILADTVAGLNNKVAITATSNNYSTPTGGLIVYYRGIHDISNYEIKRVGTETHTYDGTKHTTSIQLVKKANAPASLPSTLSSTNYAVEFTKNETAGPVTVTVKGIGEYGGTPLVNTNIFTINAKDISLCSISPIENQFQGTKVPEVTIKDGTKTLVKDLDYQVTSLAEGTIVIDGTGNYKGSVKKTFSTGTSIAAAKVTTYPETPNAKFEYTGSPCKFIMSVELYDGTKLKEGIDYKVVYDKNINVGHGTATIIGIGKYAGTLTREFEITPKNLSDYDVTVTLATDTYIWAGKKIEPAVTIKANGRTLIKDTDYTIYCYNNDKIGTATMAISGKGNYEGSITKTFKIAGKDFSTVTATLDKTTFDYNGTFHKPTATVYDGTKKLVLGTDYTIDYKDNKNCGTASAIITGKGNYTGTKTLLFDIVGKDQTITTNYTYYTKYLTSADFDLGGKTDGDGHLVYTSSNPAVAAVSAKGVVSIKGTGEAVIKVESKDDVKYNPDCKNVYVQVKPKKPAFYLTSVNKKEVRVNVTEVAGATKYQVRYGRMGNYYNKYVAHTGEGDFTVKLAKRTSGKTYFVKVRSYKKQADGTIVWGNWTTVKKIKSL